MRRPIYKHDVVIYKDEKRKVLALQYCKCINIFGMTWMAEELTLDPYFKGIYTEYDDYLNIKKSCQYGDICYYNYSETQIINNYLQGWHVPNKQEAEQLVKFANMSYQNRFACNFKYRGYILSRADDPTKYLNASGRKIFCKLWIKEPIPENHTGAYALSFTDDGPVDVSGYFTTESRMPLRLVRNKPLF